MADNSKMQGTRDRSRINADQPHEVEYVHSQFPWLSIDEIREVIRSKGPDRDTVLSFLQQKRGTAKHE